MEIWKRKYSCQIEQPVKYNLNRQVIESAVSPRIIRDQNNPFEAYISRPKLRKNAKKSRFPIADLENF